MTGSIVKSQLSKRAEAPSGSASLWHTASVGPLHSAVNVRVSAVFNLPVHATEDSTVVVVDCFRVRRPLMHVMTGSSVRLVNVHDIDL